MKNKGFFWHVHHDILCEYCYDYDLRVKAIKKKPIREIETRLRLFKKVKGKLSAEFVKIVRKYGEARRKSDEVWRKYYEARRKYDEVWRKLDEAWRKYGEVWRKLDEAWRKYDEVWRKYAPEIEKLHEKECGCKEWNGKEIVF